MRNSSNTYYQLSLLGLFLVWICIPQQAKTEELKVDVLVPADFQPHSAVGIILNPNETHRYAITDLNSQVRRKNEKELIVSFYVNSAQIGADTYATALISSEQGNSAFGTVRRVNANAPDKNVINIIPACPLPEVNNPVLAAQTSQIQQLIQLRKEKRHLLRKMLKDALDEETLSKIKMLEKLFGLNYESPFSSDLPALELSTRLSRIAIALENVDYHKQFQVTPTARAGSAP
ncbi:MAG: hypothetical protein GYA55_08375 [SAR324 cluster bacterium]|uniref:Uncharacterized protein n=1 Tax=SAR324 cluster bacterium TaxID=2024889 RepID=A0A7X9FRV0_9DELT|nr:hypothetical protein [SAR324 cluster bacterium]